MVYILQKVKKVSPLLETPSYLIDGKYFNGDWSTFGCSF